MIQGYHVFRAPNSDASRPIWPWIPWIPWPHRASRAAMALKSAAGIMWIRSSSSPKKMVCLGQLGHWWPLGQLGWSLHQQWIAMVDAEKFWWPERSRSQKKSWRTLSEIPTCSMLSLYPIGSMDGIYADIWGILMVNVTIYTSTMDPMGIWDVHRCSHSTWPLQNPVALTNTVPQVPWLSTGTLRPIAEQGLRLGRPRAGWPFEKHL